MKNTSIIYVALPVLNESENIGKVFDCLSEQSFTKFEVVVCVNQYEDWWQNDERVNICEDNLRSIALLQQIEIPKIHILDRSSIGNGWPKKKGGVGWARKTIMDFISQKAEKDDIIVSIDADTFYPSDYLQSIFNFFTKHKNLVGLALPYYHNLMGGETDRLILRYEIYMRYYLLNMMRINNPYGYTALGSAMAFPVWAYRKAGGLTPVASGEDFYFLQKLVKIGKIGIWSTSIAYPSARFSDRVLFGTGPALIKGYSGDWMSYPHYHYTMFDIVDTTFGLFDELYNIEVKTPMDEFLKEQTNTVEIWKPLRKNYKDQHNFVKACNNKVDGLRILQFLRKKHADNELKDEEIIRNFIIKYYHDEAGTNIIADLDELDYDNSSIELLNRLRDFLFQKEMDIRKLKIVNL